MGKGKIEDILSDMNPVLKKELLNSLVTSLLSELKETEKKELLQTVVTGGRKNRQVIEMVEH